MQRSFYSTLVGAAFAMACGSVSAAATGPTTAELNNAGQDAANWLYATHDYSGQRYSKLNQINRGNAARKVSGK